MFNTLVSLTGYYLGAGVGCRDKRFACSSEYFQENYGLSSLPSCFTFLGHPLTSRCIVYGEETV